MSLHIFHEVLISLIHIYSLFIYLFFFLTHPQTYVLVHLITEGVVIYSNIFFYSWIEKWLLKIVLRVLLTSPQNDLLLYTLQLEMLISLEEVGKEQEGKHKEGYG